MSFFTPSLFSTKTTMPNRFALVTLVLLYGTAFARPATAQQPGTCEPAQAENYLDINNVRARIFNNGTLFWRGDPVVYEVPRGGGVKAIFTAGLWIGGFVGDELRVAAARYSNFNFWPGPINDDGTLPDPNDCSAFDRIYKISRDDLLLYEQTGEATPDLRDWPWRLGAPVVDGDGIPDNYTLDGGDRPKIQGHQALWWVMNDLGNEHLAPSSDSPPLGLEVQAMAFAVVSNIEAIDNSTFYHYTLINKGPAPIEQAFLGFFVDPDLGNFVDDFIGSDTTRHLGFVYNADNDDEAEHGGYGESPPAAGVMLLQGPLVNDDGLDNDRDGAVDEADERLGMTRFMHYYRGAGNTEGPTSAPEYYNYLTGRWRDGQPATFGGNGRDFSEVPTPFMFPGDPATRAFWSEVNADGAGAVRNPADRRMVVSTGPFSLQPGQAQEVVYAIVWGRGADNLTSVTVMKEAADVVRDAYAVGEGVDTRLNDSPTGLPSDYTVLPNYPNPFNPATTIRFGLPEPGEVRLTVYNVLGQRVATLIDDGLPAGWHKTQWNAQNLSSGVYFYRLETGSRAVARPMLLLK